MIYTKFSWQPHPHPLPPLSPPPLLAEQISLQLYQVHMQNKVCVFVHFCLGARRGYRKSDMHIWWPVRLYSPCSVWFSPLSMTPTSVCLPAAIAVSIESNCKIIPEKVSTVMILGRCNIDLWSRNPLVFLSKSTRRETRGNVISSSLSPSRKIIVSQVMHMRNPRT